jgi:hypothetical protein
VVTNAIIAKIKDTIAESMVLPNMTDFAFCSSGGLGGIFREAIVKANMTSREEKNVDLCNNANIEKDNTDASNVTDTEDLNSIPMSESELSSIGREGKNYYFENSLH